MIWLDLHVEPAPDTGTPSVEAHWGAVYSNPLICLYQFNVSTYYYVNTILKSPKNFSLNFNTVTALPAI